jgi:hypothetical protein
MLDVWKGINNEQNVYRDNSNTMLSLMKCNKCIGVGKNPEILLNAQVFGGGLALKIVTGNVWFM